MGLFTLILAGGGFVLIGFWESLISVSPAQKQSLSSSARSKTTLLPSSVSSIAVALLSLFFIINSVISINDASKAKDRVGISLQLEVIPIALLFLLYSITGLLTNISNSIHFPNSIISLICLFAFGEEFLLFYHQSKDSSGIENRYFDLLLVPITVCLFSTVIELGSPDSNYPKLARGVGLILQGTWFTQMGLSFYSDFMAHGCKLHEKSRGNYTIKCKGHPEYHRARAIATLQFNCHLAFLVVLIVGIYSLIGSKSCDNGDYRRYKPLGAELQQMDNQSKFTLDSDEDDDEIKVESNSEKENGSMVPELSRVNGYGSHH